MKKAKIIGKKTLSVFLAVLMVLTAWVWVAPTEASAAAGSYYVKISWECTNAGNDYSIAYPGYTDRGDGNCVGISLYYKSNNGTGTESEKYWDLKSDMETATSYTETATISGFPTRIFVYNDHGGWTDKAVMKITKIEIGASSSSTLTTIWGGTISLDSTSNIKWAELKSDYTSSSDGSDDVSISTTTKGWTYPYADTITWSNTPEAMICPKTASNTAATQTVAASAKDQYGVQMFDPTWSVKGSNKSTGITVSPSTSSGSTTISVTSAANIAGTTNSQTGTVTATWTGTNAAGTSIAKTSSKTFTINDATYTATFKNHRNAAGVLQSDYTTTAQYGVTPTAPTASNYSAGDYDYSFTGWNPTVSGITADTTYTAVYSNGVFVGADYTEVNKAIAAANAIKTQYGTEYELKYTLATRVALDNAITSVVTGLGRTRQDDVDGYAQAINDAIAALEPNKFDVIFLDKDGAILLYEKDVEYKESVTAPTYSAKYYDSTNHYTFTGWDTNEYTSVVDDLVIQPVFVAEGHIFTTETVPSTCVQKGATKYTCSCGYSYIDGETNYGDHVWETEFTTDLEPTCTVAGSKSIHCSLCDAQKDITVIDPLGHNFTSQSVAVEATCGKIGIMTRVCDDCLYCEHTIIPALEHDYKETVVAPTCTTKGYTEYVCQRANCGHSYRDNFTNVVAHSYGAWETVSEARCEVAGVKKQTCTECGHVNIGSIDALQHNLSGWTTVVDRTCTGKGYQVKTCSLCNNVIEEQWLDAIGHNYVEKTVVKPTCTSKGYTIEECNRTDCGAQRIVNETAALNHAWTEVEHAADCTHSAYIEHICGNDSTHNYVEYVSGSAALTHDFTGTETIISKATCEADGKKTVQCTRCDAVNEVIIPRLGHSYGAWEVVKEATNTEKGLLSRTCINGCGEKETAEIPAGGHSFNTDEPSATTDGTCLVKGTKTFKCSAHSDCGVTITVETEFGAHEWSAWTKVDATNDKDGSWTRECAVCHKKEAHVIPAGNHNLVEDTTKYVEPKCDAKGQRVYKCDAHENCSVTITVVLEMIQHTAGVDKKDATCTENGYVKTYCTVCGDVISNVELNKTGHVETTTTRQESTCVTPGWEKVICKCGKLVSEKELPLIAHNYDANGDGKVDKKDAVFEDGTYTYTCQQAGCGHTITEDADDVYKVRFFDAAGNQIGETQNVKFGESAVAPAAPEKKADGTYHYEFSAWDRNYSEITSDLDVYPTYEKELHYGGEATCKDKALCDKCGTAYGGYDDTKHVMASKSTPATCEKDGVINYYCTLNCGYGYSEKIQKLNHNYGEWTVVQQGTCVKEHIQSRKCQNYGCDATEEYSTYKNHSWILEPAIAPTCTTVGYTEFKYCTVCNLQLDRQEVAKLSHNDRDGNGYCDYCGTSQGVPKCNCMCHSTGFMKIIYSIVRFFWIITKSSPSCSCGARHY